MAQAISPFQETSLKENCILVNERDIAIGHASKRDCHYIKGEKGLLLHRAFSVFLFNSKNELLLQKRSDTKVTFPGHVTNTCCSHPLHDIYEERDELGAIGVKLAAIRRLNIELGIPKNLITPKDLHYLTRVTYKLEWDGVWGEHEIDYVLLLKKDLPIDPNPEEVSDIYRVSRENFDSFIAKTREPLTPWFRLIAKNGLKDWWDKIDALSQFNDHLTIHQLN